MSTQNGHAPVVAATWRAEDFADLERLNEPLAVDIFEGKRPPIVIDPRGYEQFVYLGDLVNPLIREAVQAHKAQQRVIQQEPNKLWADLADEIRATNDKILAAICLEPRYCPKERLVDGRPPPGQLWYGAFSDPQRQALLNFWHSGVEALKSVRPALAADEPAARPGDGVSPTPEPAPDPARAALGPLVPGRGSGLLAEREGRGGAGDEPRDIG